MPDVDGWAVLSALRRDPATADIPVVVLSVLDDRKRAIAAGAQAVVAKPLQRAEVLRVLQNIQHAKTVPQQLLVRNKISVQSA